MPAHRVTTLDQIDSEASSPCSSQQTFAPLVDDAIVITGATASGKSEIAIRLAQQIGGEILSLDSIAVYTGMDIGTAKPTAEDRQRVPHHLIDIARPDEDFSVTRYLNAAHAALGEIKSRGKKPIFVGGTPMFLKGILRGFDPGPPPNWEFRDAVESDVERFGAESLHKRLQQVDPLAAHRIDPTDVRRMVRALEVAHHTGEPLSHRQVQFDRARAAEDCLVFSIQRPREQLHARINARVKMMFDQGLVDEVKSLLADHSELSRTASQAVGYRELIEHLRNDVPLEKTIEFVSAHTRQLARRQETWFRSFSEIRFVHTDESKSIDDAVGQIAGAISDF